MVITYSTAKDQPGKVVNQSCSWPAEQGKTVFSCSHSRLRTWSRETGSAVTSRASLFISILGLNLVFTYGIPPEYDHRTGLPYHAVGRPEGGYNSH